eukprot:m.203343 g.203343  ORF g.203343 m.203343 type:complete len:1178 (+) comp14990_c0_seq4:3-3536(+)
MIQLHPASLSISLQQSKGRRDSTCTCNDFFITSSGDRIMTTEAGSGRETSTSEVVNALRQEVVHYRRQAQQKEAECQRVLRDLDRLRLQTKAKADDWQSERQELLNAIKEAKLLHERDSVVLAQKNSAEVKENERLTQQLDITATELQDALAAVVDLKGQATKYTVTIESQQQKINTLENQLTASQTSLRHTENQLQAASQGEAAALQRLDELKDRADQQEQRAQSQILAQHERHSELARQVQQLSKRPAISEHDLQQLYQNLADMERETHRLVRTLRIKEDVIATLKDNIVDHQGKIESLEATNSMLTASFSSAVEEQRSSQKQTVCAATQTEQRLQENVVSRKWTVVFQHCDLIQSAIDELGRTCGTTSGEKPYCEVHDGVEQQREQQNPLERAAHLLEALAHQAHRMRERVAASFFAHKKHLDTEQKRVAKLQEKIRQQDDATQAARLQATRLTLAKEDAERDALSAKHELSALKLNLAALREQADETQIQYEKVQNALTALKSKHHRTSQRCEEAEATLNLVRTSVDNVLREIDHPQSHSLHGRSTPSVVSVLCDEVYKLHQTTLEAATKHQSQLRDTQQRLEWTEEQLRLAQTTAIAHRTHQDTLERNQLAALSDADARAKAAEESGAALVSEVQSRLITALAALRDGERARVTAASTVEQATWLWKQEWATTTQLLASMRAFLGFLATQRAREGHVYRYTRAALMASSLELLRGYQLKTQLRGSAPLHKFRVVAMMVCACYRLQARHRTSVWPRSLNLVSALDGSTLPLDRSGTDPELSTVRFDLDPDESNVFLKPSLSASHESVQDLSARRADMAQQIWTAVQHFHTHSMQRQTKSQKRSSPKSINTLLQTLVTATQVRSAPQIIPFGSMDYPVHTTMRPVIVDYLHSEIRASKAAALALHRDHQQLKEDFTRLKVKDSRQTKDLRVFADKLTKLQEHNASMAAQLEHVIALNRDQTDVVALKHQLHQAQQAVVELDGLRVSCSRQQQMLTQLSAVREQEREAFHSRELRLVEEIQRHADHASALQEQLKKHETQDAAAKVQLQKSAVNESHLRSQMYSLLASLTPQSDSGASELQCSTPTVGPNGGELPVDASDHHSRQETVRDTPSSPFEAIKFTALTHSTPIADGLRSQPARRGRSVVSSIHEPQQLQSELQRSFMSALDAAEHLPD